VLGAVSGGRTGVQGVSKVPYEDDLLGEVGG